LSVSKSDLIKELQKNYPNLLKKDLLKFFELFVDEIKIALKNNERVELRGWGIFFQKVQKSRNSRNPKTGEKIITPQKKNINFKMSKELFKRINEK
tara:strand:- start:688 stop:975 length:288 start_codon:yes stop_codon:yes gene_type:complete